MTQEEKQLVYKDLCGRLPYGVICRLSVKDVDISITEKLDFGGLEHFIYGTMDVLPYLRPLSSITMEEQREYISAARSMSPDNPSVLSDWLNAHHFDYRELIPMGLALEAQEGMYNSTNIA